MKTLVRLTLALSLAAGAAALWLPAPDAVAAPPDVKTVILDCDKGWRGSAVGTYGGVSFGVSCNNGRGQQRLTGTVGTAYSARVGAESDAVAVDCAFSGDANAVNETCAGVRLQIR